MNDRPFVSALVPYRPDGSQRDLRAAVTLERLRDALPARAEVLVMDDARENADLFNHGQAINRAAAASTGDVLLIADADTTFDEPGPLRAALDATRDDRRWRLPAAYFQLTERATDAFLSGDHDIEFRSPVGAWGEGVEWAGFGICWSGLVIVSREAFDLVRGADERYIGWGADDVALGQALDTLHGPHVRYPGCAVHLWHPRDDQNKGWHRHSVEQRELTERYDAAAGDAAAMRVLLEGKRRARSCGRDEGEVCGDPVYCRDNGCQL